MRSPTGEYLDVLPSGATATLRADGARYDLIPAEAIQSLARVMGHGARIHGERNWEQGMSVAHCLDRALGHIAGAMHALQHPGNATAIDAREELEHALCRLAMAVTAYERWPDLRWLPAPTRVDEPDAAER